MSEERLNDKACLVTPLLTKRTINTLISPSRATLFSSESETIHSVLLGDIYFAKCKIPVLP
jgi:hypothetical protein